MAEFDEQMLFEMGYNRGFKDGIKGSIPKADYENRLKADLKAILVELQLEIEGQSLTHSEDNILSEWGLGYNHSVERCGELIQQKIDKLKEK